MAREAPEPEGAARHVGVPQGMDRALARVRSPQGEIVGSGFLADAHHVVTCTHVVLRALGRAGAEPARAGDVVAVDFPLVAPDVLLRAEVAVSHPLEENGGGDITVVLLVGELPPGLEPARPVVADDVWGHPFRVFGFPRRLDQGVWAAGVLRAQQGSGWVQMEGAASGYAVEGGFSGGAVWDDELSGVVGMTVAADARPDLRAAFLITSRTLMRAWPPLTEWTRPPCPYRSLHAFRASDTALFFGREDVTDLLVREALRRPLLAVVGPSGSGKSSVVFAGVLPVLGRAQGWLSVSMRPAQASSPLFALAAALVPVLEPALGETERLAASNTLVTVLRDGRLADVVDSILARAQLDHLLLVVDQMEELFDHSHDEAQAFTRALRSAVRPQQDSRSRSLTVLVTLRVDFLGNALQDPDLDEVLRNAVVTIGQMRREQLRNVIEGPLPAGVRYEAGLVERILGDVGDEPGSLALLEFALTLLWEKQEAGLLTHAAYQDLGGVDGALATYAERIYSEQVLPDDQEEARRLFVQLMRPSDVSSAVRRVARRSELGERRWQLGQRLAATRLLVADRDAAGMESVELVHEALIDSWGRLQEWMTADQAFRSWQENLRGTVAAWESVHRDAGGLLRGAPLVEAERWLQERTDDLGETEQEFVRASQALRGRSTRRLQMAVAVLTVLLLVAAGLGVLAREQSVRLAEQLQLAGSRSLIGQAQQLADHQPDVALLLAAAAYRMAQTSDIASVVMRLAAKERPVERLIATDAGPIRGVEFDPTDPNKVVLYGADTIMIWDISHNGPFARWPGSGVIGRTASGSDGRAIAFQVGDTDSKELRLWFPSQGRDVLIPGAEVAYDASQIQMDFSPDGALLAICNPERIQVWEIEAQRFRDPIQKDTEACGVGLVDNRKLAYIDGPELVVYDLDAKRIVDRVNVVSTTGGAVGGEYFPDLTVASDGRFGIVDDGFGHAVWNLDPLTKSGDLGRELAGDVSLTPDGRWAVVGYEDKVVLVDVTNRTLLKSYPRYDGNNNPLVYPSAGGPFSVSPDGRRIVFPDGGNVLALVETDEAGDVVTAAEQIAVAPGDRLVSLAAWGQVTVLQTAPGGQVSIASRTSPDKAGPDRKAVLSSNGQLVAMLGEQPGDVIITKPLEPGNPGTELKDDRAVVATAFDSAAGRFLATADASAITVWPVDGGATPPRRIPLASGTTTAAIALHPDGTFVAAYNSAGSAYIWDVISGQQLTLPMKGVRAVAFSSDGKWMSVSTSTDIRIWDVEHRQESPVLLPASTDDLVDPLPPANFSQDGRYLAAPRVADGYTRTSVWRLDTGTLVGEVGGYASDVAFLSDSKRLAVAVGVADAEAGLFVTELDPQALVDTICRVVGRKLTTDEWNQYAAGLPYEPTC